MYPNPPMPRRTIGARLRNLSLPLKLLAGGGAGLALLLVCFCALAALGAVLSIGKPNTSASTTPTAALVQGVTPTPTATFTPTPSPTPAGPRILTGATLGGLQSAFQATYGAPEGTGTAKLYHFTIGGQDGVVTATTFSTPVSPDGKFHIASLRIGPPSGVWTASQAQPICSAFLPPDARFQRVQQVAGYGNERVYTSASLALSFNASEFADTTTGKRVAAGTFAMELWPGTAGNTGCILILGE